MILKFEQTWLSGYEIKINLFRCKQQLSDIYIYISVNDLKIFENKNKIFRTQLRNVKTECSWKKDLVTAINVIN